MPSDILPRAEWLSMKPMMRATDLETEVEKVGRSFHEDKARAVRCWLEAVSVCGVDDKVLAAECQVSKSHFSKISNGDGDLLSLVYRLPMPDRKSLRDDFFARLAEAERVDLETITAEQLALAAIRFLRVRGSARMLKADVRMTAKAEAI